MASENSGSDTRSQNQGSKLALAESGRPAVGMGMAGYGLSRSVGVQGSDTSHSSLVLTHLQQSSDSVLKPVQLTSLIPLKTSRETLENPDTQPLVQTISQFNGPQPAQASSGAMAQSSSQQLTQTSGQH